MSACPYCGGSVIGSGELATCARCARFVHETRDAIEQSFDRMRAGLSEAEREGERRIRRSCFPLPRLLSAED